MTLNRVLQWEFWPWWIFYFPVYFYYIWLSLKARSFIFFSAVNPNMEMGGFIGYSKSDILNRVPLEYQPKGIKFSGEMDSSEVIKSAGQTGITFPFIVKPDRGERGYGVEKINSEMELKAYFKQFHPAEIIIQEYVELPLELGIMYSRIPGDHDGNITSIVIKKFMEITGDGTSTMRQLISNDRRNNRYLKLLEKRMGTRIDEVIPNGKTLELDPIGNHCRGTTFLNGNHLINDDLISVFNRISLAMGDHYFGRFDLKVSSLQDLYRGKNLKILEVNGANSEPAHIYDPGMSILKAYRHLFKHWKRLYRVSIANRRRGVRYTGFVTGFRMLIRYFANRYKTDSLK